MAIDPAEMRGLLDRQAITEQIYRYCRAVDRLDIPLGHSVFHEDATADYGDSLYRGDGRGVIDFICAAHLLALSHSHQVCNSIIALGRWCLTGFVGPMVTAELAVMPGAWRRSVACWVG